MNGYKPLFLYVSDMNDGLDQLAQTVGEHCLSPGKLVSRINLFLFVEIFEKLNTPVRRIGGIFMGGLGGLSLIY